MHGVQGRKGFFTKKDLRKGKLHQYTQRGETCVKLDVATWPDWPQYFKAMLVRSNCIKGPGSSLVLFVGTSKSSKGDKPMGEKKKTATRMTYLTPPTAHWGSCHLTFAQDLGCSPHQDHPSLPPGSLPPPLSLTPASPSPRSLL